MSHSRQERPFRAGPPTLRNAPPTHDVVHGSEVTPDTPQQYASRDAACAEWVERNYVSDDVALVGPREIMIAKTAFAAGWSARKHAQYQALVEK